MNGEVLFNYECQSNRENCYRRIYRTGRVLKLSLIPFRSVSILKLNFILREKHFCELKQNKSQGLQAARENVATSNLKMLAVSDS